MVKSRGLTSFDYSDRKKLAIKQLFIINCSDFECLLIKNLLFIFYF